MFFKFFNKNISVFKNGLEDWFNCFYLSSNWNYTDLKFITKFIYFFIFIYFLIFFLNLSIYELIIFYDYSFTINYELAHYLTKEANFFVFN